NHRRDHRRARLLELFHRAVVEGHCHGIGGCKKARRGSGLGQLPDDRPQFSHYLIFAVPCDSRICEVAKVRGRQPSRACEAVARGGTAHRDPRSSENVTVWKAAGISTGPERFAPTRILVRRPSMIWMTARAGNAIPTAICTSAA